MSTDFESKARAALAAINDVAALHRKHGEHPLAITTEEARVRELESRLRAQDRESLGRVERVVQVLINRWANTLNSSEGAHGADEANALTEALAAIRALASEPDAGTEGRPSYCSKHQTPQADCPLCNPTGWSVAPSTAGSAARREAMIEGALVKARDLLHWHLGTTITDDSAIEEAEACIEQADAALDAK